MFLLKRMVPVPRFRYNHRLIPHYVVVLGQLGFAHRIGIGKQCAIAELVHEHEAKLAGGIDGALRAGIRVVNLAHSSVSGLLVSHSYRLPSSRTASYTWAVTPLDSSEAQRLDWASKKHGRPGTGLGAEDLDFFEGDESLETGPSHEEE